MNPSCLGDQKKASNMVSTRLHCIADKLQMCESMLKSPSLGYVWSQFMRRLAGINLCLKRLINSYDSDNSPEDAMLWEVIRSFTRACILSLLLVREEKVWAKDVGMKRRPTPQADGPFRHRPLAVSLPPFSGVDWLRTRPRTQSSSSRQ